MRRDSGFRFAALSTVVATLLLTACSEEAPGPQFANEPAPTREATATVAVASPVPRIATPVPVATPSSIGDLLNVRGAPSVVYSASSSAVWMIATNGDATRLYQAPANTRILAFDAGPSSLEVAILIQPLGGDKDGATLLIVDREGAVKKRITGLDSDAATPLPSTGGAVDLVNWSPQGDRALVAFRSGRIYDVPIDDSASATPLQFGAGVEIVQPTWSPTGESIAYIAADANSRTRSLDVFDVASGKTRTVVESADGRFVVDFVWMPDGVSLQFTEGGELGGANTGIDLWRISAVGQDRSLMASAGTVAPVARITTMRPSPDGRSVAYAALVPGDDGPVVDSVWVRDIVSGVAYRIPLPTVSAVQDLVWTDQGIVITVLSGGRDSGRSEVLAMLLVNRKGEVSVLWAAPVAEGTPASASPVASPVGD